MSPLLREAKDTAIGDTMYDKGRSCEYLFLSSNVNGFYYCCGWDIDGRQKCPQKIENSEEILSFQFYAGCSLLLVEEQASPVAWTSFIEA